MFKVFLKPEPKPTAEFNVLHTSKVDSAWVDWQCWTADMST